MDITLKNGATEREKQIIRAIIITYQNQLWIIAKSRHPNADDLPRNEIIGMKRQLAKFAADCFPDIDVSDFVTEAN